MKGHYSYIIIGYRMSQVVYFWRKEDQGLLDILCIMYILKKSIIMTVASRKKGLRRDQTKDLNILCSFILEYILCKLYVVANNFRL